MNSSLNCVVIVVVVTIVDGPDKWERLMKAEIHSVEGSAHRAVIPLCPRCLDAN
jgi:hypothetical protein